MRINSKENEIDKFLRMIELNEKEKKEEKEYIREPYQRKLWIKNKKLSRIL